MQLRFLPFAASAVGGRSFLATIPRPVRASRRRLCYNVASSSSSEKEGEEAEAGGKRDEAEAGRKRDEPGTQEEALRRLAELDAQLEGLSEPKKRPPVPPPSPDPYMDRDMITGRRYTDELPEFSPTYVAFSTLALVILTIFTNVMFNLYIKPSVDGVDQPVRIQRVPLVDPADRQFK